MIEVTIKIEGISEREGLLYKLEPGTTILGMADEIKSSKNADNELLKSALFDKRTGEIGIYMVLLNNKSVRLQEFGSTILKMGDEVTLILPFAGG